MGTTAQRAGVMAAAALAAASVCCASEPKVSPWPQNVTLGALLHPVDVGEHLERIDDEMRAESMAMTEEVTGAFEDGEPFVVRCYRGLDAMGHERDAVRVATRFGVVMAIGPLAAADSLSGQRTRLVSSLGKAGQWRTGTDLNGDGMPDVVVAVGQGELQIWGLHAQGASPYTIVMLTPPSRAEDIDADGRPELVAEVGVASEALAPRWLEVASFAAGQYRADSAVVRAAHARWMREVANGGGQVEVTRAARMERALERAWHAVRSGAEWAPTLERLRKDKHEAGEGTLSQEASWSRWVQRLASIGAPDGRAPSQ